MRKNVSVIKLFLCMMVMLSCSEESLKPLSREEALQFLGTEKFENIRAAYNDELGYSFLIDDTISKKAYRVFCNKGFPNVLDTLEKLNTGIFQSQSHHTLFEIREQEVKITYFQKIIHPSSNWQGQTPWQEVHVFSSPRIDLNLK